MAHKKTLHRIIILMIQLCKTLRIKIIVAPCEQTLQKTEKSGDKTQTLFYNNRSVIKPFKSILKELTILFRYFNNHLMIGEENT